LKENRIASYFISKLGVRTHHHESSWFLQFLMLLDSCEPEINPRVSLLEG